ncbi:MAG: twin-arginine translocase TatA/TatE family subunit [Xanthomonadaceae bacterium]|nr:twin-arginine translocase TatA/TatE family subunit [Xanthomonadaceae bacterium]
MGFGGISIWQLLIILVIVVLLFGTGKLRSLGSDLGGAIKNFRSGVKSADDEPKADDPEQRPGDSDSR